MSADSLEVDPPATNPPAQPVVPRWHLHRRLYDWVLHWANTPYGGPALFVMAFAESSFFPVPPDVLLAPLVLGNRRKWAAYAAACSVASILGGILGYFIGAALWAGISNWVYALHIPGLNAENFDKARHWYETWNFWVVFICGFTFLPFKVCTISAGVFFGWNPASFLIFLVASAVSRTARFFLVAGLMGVIGPSIKPIIDRYFNVLCLAFVALLIGGFAVLKYVL